MKVLFLDVDGVLNTYESGGLFTLNKKRLKLLQQVVDETGCSIVLSSTWRKDSYAFNKLKKRLSYRGLIISGHTRTDYFKERQTRGDEIKDWCDSRNIIEYAIIDDHNDMLEEQQDKFVQTDSYEGLTEEKVIELIEVLNGSRIHRSHGGRPESS